MEKLTKEEQKNYSYLDKKIEKKYQLVRNSKLNQGAAFLFATATWLVPSLVSDNPDLLFGSGVISGISLLATIYCANKSIKSDEEKRRVEKAFYKKYRDILEEGKIKVNSETKEKYPRLITYLNKR